MKNKEMKGYDLFNNVVYFVMHSPFVFHQTNTYDN